MAKKPAKSSTFIWEGKDKSGRKVKGETDGSSIALVKAELRKQSIKVSKIKKKSISFGGKGGKIKPLISPCLPASLPP